jgi:hypothetical protein
MSEIPNPPPFRHTVNRTFKILLSLVVPIGLAAFSAWLISSHLAPRPFATAFWPCLGCTVFMSAVLITFTVVEAVIACGILFLVGLVGTPSLARRLSAPALPYVAASALVAGFASSRVLRTAL